MDNTQKKSEHEINLIISETTSFIKYVTNKISKIESKKIYQLRTRDLKDQFFYINGIVDKKILFLKSLVIENIEQKNIIENLIKQLEKLLVNNRKLNSSNLIKIKKRVIFILIFFELMILGFFIFIIRTESKKLVDKYSLQSDFKKAINNKADINVLKNIAFLHPTAKIKEALFKREQNFYKKPINLEQVLKDIKSDNYLSNEFDNVLNENIVNLLNNEKQISPIDKLDKNQAHYFHNIKSKVDPNIYSKIETDILKIVDELSIKNEIINKYLNQSNTSYLISWIALFISLLGLPLIFIQMVQYFQQFRNEKKHNNLKNNSTDS